MKKGSGWRDMAMREVIVQMIAPAPVLDPKTINSITINEYNNLTLLTGEFRTDLCLAKP